MYLLILLVCLEIFLSFLFPLLPFPPLFPCFLSDNFVFLFFPHIDFSLYMGLKFMHADYSFIAALRAVTCLLKLTNT